MNSKHGGRVRSFGKTIPKWFWIGVAAIFVCFVAEEINARFSYWALSAADIKHKHAVVVASENRVTLISAIEVVLWICLAASVCETKAREALRSRQSARRQNSN